MLHEDEELQGSNVDDVKSEDEFDSEYESMNEENRRLDEDERIKGLINSEISKTLKKKSRLDLFIYLMIGLIVGLLVSKMGGLDNSTNYSSNRSQSEQQIINIIPSENPSIEKVVAAKTIPSIVGITTQSSVQSFFGNELVEGVGSGVIVSDNGYIITNSHVIENGKAKKIEVLLDNGESIDARLVWNDTFVDLAVIKIEKTGLQAIEMGDSDKISVGEKAIAIGNPLGLDLQSTLTSGYISGLNRSIRVDTGISMTGLFQTDAAINKGNSGGALLDSEGKLIAINTAKTGAGEGIGFAIPINVAKPVIDTIIEKGSYTSPYIGIFGQEAMLYKRYIDPNFGMNKGIVISDIEIDSPADRYGIKSGDVIIAIDNVAINTMNDLKKTLFKFKVGDTVKIKVVRNGKEIVVDLRLGSPDLSI